MLLAEAGVELPVGAEREPSTLVAAVVAGREAHQRGEGAAGAGAVRPPYDVLVLPVGMGDEGVDEVVGGEGGAHGQAQQTPFAVAAARFGGDRGDLGELLDRAVLEDPHGARPFGEEEPAVGGEGHGGGVVGVHRASRRGLGPEGAWVRGRQPRWWRS